MDDILPGLMVVAIAISMIFVLLKFIPYYISAKKLAYALKDIPGDPPHWLWGNLVGVSITGASFMVKNLKIQISI